MKNFIEHPFLFLTLTFCIVLGAGTSQSQVEQIPSQLNTIQNDATTNHGECATCTAASKIGVVNGKDPCSFEALTDDCKVFDAAKGPKIQYPDGTFIPNYSLLLDPLKLEAKENSPETDKKLRAQVSANDRLLFTFQQELDGVTGLSPFFKMELGKQLFKGTDEVGTIFGQQSAGGQDTQQISLPWPASDPNAALKLLPTGMVEQYLQQTLSPDEFKKLGSQIKAYRDATATNAAEKVIFDDPTLQALKQATPERQKHVNALVEYVRKTIENQIRAGRTDDQLTDDEKNAIATVDKIRPKGFDDVELQKSPTCNQPIPNAFYDPEDHTINLCQNFYNFPDSTVVSILGHEMTHSIDPCNIQSTMYKIDGDKLKTMIDPQTQEPIDEIGKDPDLYEAFSNIQDLSGETSLTKYPFELQGIKPNAIEYFKKMGVITPTIPGEKSLSKYVLGDVYSCLISDQGGKFRSSADPAAIAKIVNTVVDAEAKNAIGPFDKEARAKKITQAFSDFPECVSAQDHTQMCEAMADWMGSRILGEYEKGKKLVTPEDRLAPIGFFATAGCSEFTGAQEIRNDPRKGPADIISQVLEEYKGLSDEHPMDKDRVNKIFLSDPNTRAALSCDPTDQGCAHKGQTL